jgi:hypothetical protein
MLALNSPVIKTGFYISQNEPGHGELSRLSATENGAVIGPDAVFRLMKDIDAIHLMPKNDDTPSEIAVGAAKRLICEAQNMRPIFLLASVVECSEGDLLIHWDTAIKNVVLVSPGSSNKPSTIYKETLDGRVAIHSELTKASAEELSDALAWVLQPR